MGKIDGSASCRARNLISALRSVPGFASDLNYRRRRRRRLSVNDAVHRSRFQRRGETF